MILTPTSQLSAHYSLEPHTPLCVKQNVNADMIMQNDN